MSWRRIVFLVALVSVLGGCSANWFRQSADNEVLPLVKARERKTVGYDAQVQVKPTPAPKVSARAYAKIPQSPIPPPQVAPLETPQPVIPYAPLGPSFPPPVGEASRYAEQQLGISNSALVPVGNVYGPPVPQQLRRLFDLFASIAYGTEHSRDYQTQMETLYLAALDVTLQRHLFVPQPFGNTGLQYSGGFQNSLKYQSALAATTTLGVKQQLPYGGQIVAQGLVQFIDALDSQTQGGESASIALSGSIPLLRGAGMVNLEPLIQSERTLVYQVRDFERYRQQFAVNVAQQYFGLVTSQQLVNNRRQNVANLTALLERTQALFDAGRLNFLEVQRSLQALLTGENDLSDALASYQNQLDTFKLLLGMPVENDLDVMPVELDVAVPDVDRQDVVATAHHYRLDLQTTRDAIDDARRQVDVAKNGLLPDLNLTAQGQVGDRTSTPAAAFDNRATAYSAGLTLGFPLDRLAERNVYRKSLIQFEQSQRGYVQLRDSITAEVRADARSIRSAQISVDLQRRSIRLAENRLEYSLELLRRGTVNARDVVESQSSLLDAEDAYSRARSNLQVQVLEFLKDAGTLRVDPAAGSLGRALDRQGELSANEGSNGV